MQIKGKITEIGALENNGGAVGLVLKTNDGEVHITGLTHRQCRELADMFGETCVLSIGENGI